MTSDTVGQSIVAGADGSASADQAARWAAAEAQRRGLALRLVHVVNVTAFAYTGGLAAPQEFYDAMAEDARQQLAEARQTIQADFPALTIDTEMLLGSPPEALIAESAQARLLVLGSRGLGGFAGMVVGSTAVALAMHGRCPVVVVRGRTPEDAPPSGGPVVVGVDGSPASEVATALAFEEASFRAAELVAVHTWTEFVSDASYARAHRMIANWDDEPDRQERMLAERLAGWSEKFPDVAVRRVVVRDRPVRCLLDHAADAQLLVVGSRGHGGFSGMLLGSTSQALIYHAPCPLIVARAAEA